VIDVLGKIMSMILTVIVDSNCHRAILALERGGHDMKGDVVATHV
jgi:hypothetical protein